MLVLQTQKNKSREPEWITIVAGDKTLRVTAKIEPFGPMKNRVVMVFDAEKDIKIIRDSVDTADNRGNR